MSASTPTPTQARFIKAVIEAGGRDITFGALPLRTRPLDTTIWACRANGWIEGDPNKSWDPWTVTEAGCAAIGVSMPTAAGQGSAEATTIGLTEKERRYLAEWLRTQMTDEAESLLLKLDG